MIWKDSDVSIGYLRGKELLDFVYDYFSSLGPIPENQGSFFILPVKH